MKLKKKIGIYTATKKEILNAYDRTYDSSEELYHHFYPNRGTQRKYVRKTVLAEINRDFKKEFLRDDLIDVNERFGQSILKDFDDMEEELTKIDVTKKSKILKVMKCYYHPDDYKKEKLKSLRELWREIGVEVPPKKAKRPSPSQSAKDYHVGQTRKGNDGKMYEVKETKSKVKRWVKKKIL